MKDSRARRDRAATAASWPASPRWLRPALVSLVGLVPLAACGMDGAEGMDEGGSGVGGGAPGGDVTSSVAAGTGGAPPEEELESSFTAPVATGHFVWVANPASGRVAYIDARSLEVRVVEAGHEPT